MTGGRWSSPNWDERPAGTAIRGLVLHYTGMADAVAALRRLCDPAAKVSSHYLVDEDGRVLRLVEERLRAWHAGRSSWRGIEALNDCSIGVEIVNPGHAHGLRPFPQRQIAAVTELAGDLVRRFRIAPGWVVGHSDIAPDRKLDPGERFPWQALAEAGIGSWPGVVAPEVPQPADASLRLAEIGYGGLGAAPGVRLALAAFQRRYRPWRVDGRLDPGTMARLDAAARLAADL